MIRILLLLLSSLVFATAQEKPTPPSEIPSFELPDQHEKLRQVHFPREKPSMFIVSDQKGSDQIAPWVRPIRQRYQTQIEIEGIADLSPVPKRLRNVVRKAFKDELDYSVMLDWEGIISRRFNYTKQKANVFIVDTAGKVLFHAAGKVSQDQLKRIYEILDSKVKASP